ncbi:MAG: hypothetical protein ACOC85_05210, partial [Thermoplasmatota archaeon]
NYFFLCRNVNKCMNYNFYNKRTRMRSKGSTAIHKSGVKERREPINILEEKIDLYLGQKGR